MTVRVPKWLLLGVGGLVVVAIAVVVVVVVTGGGGDADEGCVDKTNGNPVPCEQTLIAIPADEYEPPAASPQELTEAYGAIAGTCLAASLGPLDYTDIAETRANLTTLTDAAAANPETPTADAGQTVRDVLFDLVGQMKGCDAGLEAELQHAIDSLP